jgi:toxin ParE1/3/4
MKYALKLLPIVYKDLQKAKKWYTTINADLGEDFKSKINQEFEYINQYPKHYQKKHMDIRQGFVSRFPYAIYYIIEENKKTILIIGVLAQKQSFEKIAKRI